MRGQTLLRTRPLVHVGFLKSWLAGGLNEKVLARIMQLVMASPAGNTQCLKIQVTGMPSCLLPTFTYIVCSVRQKMHDVVRSVSVHGFGAQGILWAGP